MSSPFNPTGIVLTQQQHDESFRGSYWDHAVRAAAFYYIAGRYSVVAGFMIVHANILHHGAEMFIKAVLARHDTADRIREYGHPKRGYGHSLGKLWQDLKVRNPGRDFTPHDPTVAALDKFEDIRYPEKLLKNGAQIVINLHDVPPMASSNLGNVPGFELSLPAIDRLMALLFELVEYSPEVMRMHLKSEHAVRYHNLYNTSPMLTLSDQVPDRAAPVKRRMDWSNTWLQGLIFLLAGAVIGWGISYFYAREAGQDAERQNRMLTTLLVTGAENGDLELNYDAHGRITGGRIIRLKGGAASESTATGDLTTGLPPAKAGGDAPPVRPDSRNQ